MNVTKIYTVLFFAIGILVCFFLTFFSFLAIFLWGVGAAVPYFVLALIVFVIVFAVPNQLRQKQPPRCRPSLKRAPTEKKKPQENLKPLSFYESLRKIDRAFAENKAAPFASNDSLSPSALAQRLCSFAAMGGMHMSEESARSLLSEMACSHLVRLKTDEKEARETVALLSAFFGTCAHTTHLSAENESSLPLFFDEEESASGLLLDLYAAKHTSERVCVTLLENVSESFLCCTLHPFIRKFFGAEAAASLAFPPASNALPLAYLGNGYEFSMPKNIWFFYTEEGASPTDASHTATALLKCRAHESAATPPLSVSFDLFTALWESAIEENFVSEAVWKKCDVFFSLLEKETGVKAENKDARKIESLSSLFLAFHRGASDEEALAYALARHFENALSNAATNENAKTLFSRLSYAAFGKNIFALTA